MKLQFSTCLVRILKWNLEGPKDSYHGEFRKSSNVMSFIQGQFVSDFRERVGRGAVWGPAAFTLMYPAEEEAGSSMSDPHHL